MKLQITAHRANGCLERPEGGALAWCDAYARSKAFSEYKFFRKVLLGEGAENLLKGSGTHCPNPFKIHRCIVAAKLAHWRLGRVVEGFG